MKEDESALLIYLLFTLGSLGTGNLGKGKNLLARGDSSLSLGHLAQLSMQ